VPRVAETRQRILDTARELFNERGLHRVGVRDIARAVGMSPGNLGYHFPTKDDLVAALVLELHRLNARTVFAELPASFSLLGLYRAAVWAMRNILRYRFIQLSYVDAMTVSAELSEMETTLWVKRRRRNQTMMDLLARSGHLDARKFGARAEYLHEQGQMISSGWLTAAKLRPELRDERQIVLHYAKVGVALLEPYCTPKGAKEMRRILAAEYDRDTWRGVAASIEAVDSVGQPSDTGDARRGPPR
jgi:AcrR family transcriptional regulator